jgi:hypothetical protein
MEKSQIAVFAVITAASMCGCGTICNFAAPVINPAKETRVYGGVQFDLEVLDSAASHPDVQVAKDPRAALFLCPIAALDPLLCVAADTATLPITLYLQEQREKKRRRPPVPWPEPMPDTPFLGKAALSAPEPLPSPIPAQLAEGSR